MPDSVTPELPRATAVVAHDAGAANIIFAWIDAGVVPGDRVYAEGPAATLWDARPRPPRLASLEQALNGAAALVTGTGWASDLEHAARRLARKRGLFAAAVVDHWVNYQARFERDGEIVYPDEIWITDGYAEAMAREGFPSLTIRRLPNLYLDAEVAAIGAQGAATHAGDVLYLLEPARSTWGRAAAGEFQALDYLIENWPALGLPDGARVWLRPHPSDENGKYAAWMAAHPRRCAGLDVSPRVSDAISRVNTVAGCNSFALVIALQAGRRVICSLPPWAPPCVLPHSGIERLAQMG